MKCADLRREALAVLALEHERLCVASPAATERLPLLRGAGETCVVCEGRELAAGVCLDQCDGPPLRFCGQRCFRLFSPWIEAIVEASGERDERWLGVDHAAAEAALEEAVGAVRRALQLSRALRGLVHMVRAFFWLQRRARARRLVQRAAQHFLYRPGGRGYQRVVASAEWASAGRRPCKAIRVPSSVRVDMSCDAPWGVLLSPGTAFSQMGLSLRSVLALRSTCSSAASRLPVGSLQRHFGVEPSIHTKRFQLRAQMALHHLLHRIGRLTRGRCCIAGSFSLARHLRATASPTSVTHPDRWWPPCSDVDVFFDTTALPAAQVPAVMAAARRHAVRMLRRAHGLPQARVRRAKRGTEEYAVATAADAGGDALSASSIAPCFHALARAGVPSEAGAGVGRRYEVVDSKTLFLAEPDCDLRDYVAPMPYAINLVEVSWQSAPPLKSEFAAALIGGFDMRQCAVAHELTDGFQLREVVSAAARDAVWQRQMVPTVHAFEMASPTLSEEQMMAVRLCRLVKRVDKYHRRGFTLPTAWGRPEVCEQVRLTLSTCTWHSAGALKQALVVLAKLLSPPCGPRRQLASGVWIQDGTSLSDSSLVELEGVDAAGTVCMDVDCTSIGGDGAAVRGADEDAPAIVLFLCEHGSAHGGTVSANNALGMAFNSGGRTQGHRRRLQVRERGGVCAALPLLCGGAYQQRLGGRQRNPKRANPEERRAEQCLNTQRRRRAREDPSVRRAEQCLDTQRRRRAREAPSVRRAEQCSDTQRRALRRKALEFRLDERRLDAAGRAHSRNESTYRAREAAFTSERHRRKLGTAEVANFNVLYKLHAASGACVTSNSRRLRTLRQACDDAQTEGLDAESKELEAAYEQAREDTRRDIKDFARVTSKDQRRAVRAFHNCMERAAENCSIICAACGVRSIEEAFHGPFKLSEIDDDHRLHWLRVDSRGLACLDRLHRLDASNPIELLAQNTSGHHGDTLRVQVPRRALHNLYSDGCSTFHIVPEGVCEGGNVYLCGQCHQWCDPRSKPSVRTRSGEVDAGGERGDGDANIGTEEEEQLRISDLYRSHAPRNAIAGGHDYGRLSKLIEYGVAVDVSALEKLVLAKARCHLVTIKVVSMMYGKARTRQQLHGHSVIFPHAPVGLFFVTQRFWMKASVLRLSEGKRGDLYNELAGAIRGVIDRHIATRDMSITVADAAGKGCHELSLVEDVSIEDSSSDSSAGDRVELTVVIKVRDQATAKFVCEDGLVGAASAASAELNTCIQEASAPRISLGHFGAAALQAAFDAVRIMFVGPKDHRTKLESAALALPDLRLRPHVLFNFLALRAKLHGEQQPPAIDKIEALLIKFNKREQLQKRTHHIESEELELAAAPSDVAAVRACARPEAYVDHDSVDASYPHMEHVAVFEHVEQGMEAVVKGIDDCVAKGRAWHLKVSPCTMAQYEELRAICTDASQVSFYGMDAIDPESEHYESLAAHILLRRSRSTTDMGKLITGVGAASWTLAPDLLLREKRMALGMQYAVSQDHVFSSEDEQRDSSEQATNRGGTLAESSEAAKSLPTHSSKGVRHTGSPLRLQRSETPVDDYTSAAEALYDAWWPLFPLRRGLLLNEPLSNDKVSEAPLGM